MDRQTTCDRNTALCTKVHRAVKTFIQPRYGTLSTVAQYQSYIMILQSSSQVINESQFILPDLLLLLFR